MSCNLDIKLEDLRPEQIVDQWWGVKDGPPPPISPLLLVPILAYEIQAQKQKSEMKEFRRRIDRLIADRMSSRGAKERTVINVRDGMVLERRWQGGIHRVVAEEGGYKYNGKTYRSLSQIARLITGTRWSGPAFFGLKGKRQLIHEN